jgi:cytochrome c oxidase subunit 3/cytochrome o ubiquinol oxidase subunit 3
MNDANATFENGGAGGDSAFRPELTRRGGPSALANPTKAGMLAFLLSEVAFFSTLISTYVVFLHETKTSDPCPAKVFADDMPLMWAATICLLASSVTIHLAEGAMRRGSRESFLGYWGLTILLGATFLAFTAKEWYRLIHLDTPLTISRNMFGSTFFTLVGFHAAHVTVGLIVLSIIWLLALRREVSARNPVGVEVVSWYWHFVDGVWIVVFSLVYWIGR